MFFAIGPCSAPVTAAVSRTDLRAGTMPAPAHSADFLLIQSMKTFAACSLFWSLLVWLVM